MAARIVSSSSPPCSAPGRRQLPWLASMCTAPDGPAMARTATYEAAAPESQTTLLRCSRICASSARQGSDAESPTSTMPRVGVGSTFRFCGLTLSCSCCNPPAPRHTPRRSPSILCTRPILPLCCAALWSRSTTQRSPGSTVLARIRRRRFQDTWHCLVPRRHRLRLACAHVIVLENTIASLHYSLITLTVSLPRTARDALG